MSVNFKALNIAILTVSDTRNFTNDISGKYLNDAAIEAGHTVLFHEICIDNRYQIRSIISNWIADPQISVILITGGTGIYERDITPEAVSVLFDKSIDGFGEVFRVISLEEIGMSTIQSRALAGIANRTGIFCLPGSTNACKTAWDKILKAQFDRSTKSCNFVEYFTKN